MHQIIGFILLVVAIAGGLYLAVHYDKLADLKIAIPIGIRVPSLPSVGSGATSTFPPAN